MRLVGLTGSIATGKTTVAAMFKKMYNVPIINVDDASRSVTKFGSPVLDEIVKCFGEDSLDEYGTLNRSYLRQIIIKDKDKAKELEDIVIPAISNLVASQLEDLAESGNEIVLVENAVMFEKGMYERYDEIIVVTCSKETQLQRVMHRDNQTEEQAQGMINLQLPLDEKEKLATYIITNDGVIPIAYEVERVWNQIMEKTDES